MTSGIDALPQTALSSASSEVQCYIITYLLSFTVTSTEGLTATCAAAFELP